MKEENFYSQIYIDYDPNRGNSPPVKACWMTKEYEIISCRYFGKVAAKSQKVLHQRTKETVVYEIHSSCA
jgi:hypothetical protein